MVHYALYESPNLTKILTISMGSAIFILRNNLYRFYMDYFSLSIIIIITYKKTIVSQVWFHTASIPEHYLWQGSKELDNNDQSLKISPIEQ